MSETAANIKFQGDQAGQNGSKVQSDVNSDVRQGSQQQGADAGGEEVRRSTEVFAESQREFMEKAMRRFDEVSRKVTDSAQGSTETVCTLLALPSAAQGGLQHVQQSMTCLIEGVVRTNIRVTQELFQLANPTAYVELQQRFAKEYLDTLMQGVATIVRATRRIADETLRPLEQQIEQRRLQAAE